MFVELNLGWDYRDEEEVEDYELLDRLIEGGDIG